jgi:hypothetical protein
MRWCFSVVIICALLTAACGGGEPEAAAPTPKPTVAPELARAPEAAGEIVVTGDSSPASHGPYRFDGRYTVRFEQYEPDDPGVDFGGETSFVADLNREAEITRGDSVPLFEAARAEDERTVRIDGEFYVDVGFGDHPYVIRFTPRG